MSKQAAPKLVHGALNVVWEELKICDFLGVDTQASPSPLGSSRTKIKWVDQPQASNPFEIIHIRDTNYESFRTRWSQNRIGQAHFSLLTECDCLVDGFITDGNDYEMSLRTSEAWSCSLRGSIVTRAPADKSSAAAWSANKTACLALAGRMSSVRICITLGEAAAVANSLDSGWNRVVRRHDSVMPNNSQLSHFKKRI